MSWPLFILIMLSLMPLPALIFLFFLNRQNNDKIFMESIKEAFKEEFDKAQEDACEKHDKITPISKVRRRVRQLKKSKPRK